RLLCNDSAELRCRRTMKSPWTRPERLFLAGVAALEAATKRHMSDYLCPLCITLFPRAALDVRDLTLEHVPPASQRGRRFVLTCKQCNDGAGHGPDAH